MYRIFGVMVVNIHGLMLSEILISGRESMSHIHCTSSDATIRGARSEDREI